MWGEGRLCGALLGSGPMLTGMHDHGALRLLGGLPRNTSIALGALVMGALAVALRVIPIHGGRSADEAGRATAACLQVLRAQHGLELNFADDIQVNGGNASEAIVIGSATTSTERMAFVCETREEGGSEWQVTSLQASVAAS
jgi:hypothetical protein